MQAPQVMYHFPRWSPDGLSIMAIGMTPNGTSLLIFADTGGAPRRINLGNLQVMAADWMRGGRIRFLETRPGLKPREFQIDTSGANLREVPVDSIVSANRDSSLMLFEADRGGFSTVFLLDARTRTSRALTHLVWAEQPSFSHDGRYVVFERRRDANRMDLSEVVTIDSAGNNERVLAMGTDPSWSPGDSLVLFKAMDPAGGLWIAVANTKTGHVTRLAQGVHPHWSPSGRHVVYMVDRPDHSADIYTLRMSDRSIRCITCSRKSP